MFVGANVWRMSRIRFDSKTALRAGTTVRNKRSWLHRAYRGPTAYLVLLLASLLISTGARAQNSCLVYTFVDQYSGCTASGSSAEAAVEGVFACDGPKFCGSSYDVLDAVIGDTHQPGTTFTTIITFNAIPSPQCGTTGTGPGQGTISLASGAQCQLQYYTQAPTPDNSECSSCNGVSEPVDPAVGNVYKTEDDVVRLGSRGLRFQRFYNSADRRVARISHRAGVTVIVVVSQQSPPNLIGPTQYWESVSPLCTLTQVLPALPDSVRSAAPWSDGRLRRRLGTVPHVLSKTEGARVEPYRCIQPPYWAPLRLNQ